MLHLHSDTSECLQESNFFDHNQISPSALECIVFFNLNANIDITSNDTGLNRPKNTYSSFYPVKM